MSNSKRLFVGIGLSDEAKRAMKKLYKVLERKHWPVRWETVEKLHITLAFLGDVDDTKISSVESAVNESMVGVEGFELGFKGMGAFPDLLLPRHLWLGMNGDLKSLYSLNKAIRRGLDKEGVFNDKKTFRPHVTLGRVERDARRKVRLEMGKEVSKMRELNIPLKLRVESVAVFESVLKQTGSEYNVLFEYKLKNSGI